MPVLVYAIPEDFHELFQDGRLTSIALLRKFRRVVVVAVHAAFMFVVRILGAENGRANRAGKVLNVVLSVQRCDV
jgi:hypothetical protein